MENFIVEVKTPVLPKHIIVKECCKTFKAYVTEDNILGISCNIPFEDKEIKPTVYIFSDGGHGGSAPIKYCPFCGTKIEMRIQPDVERLV